MTERQHRTLRAMLFTSASLFALVLCVACAHATELPVPCEVIAQQAEAHGITNTIAGKAKALALLAANGLMLTTAQAQEAAKCLPPAKAK